MTTKITAIIETPLALTDGISKTDVSIENFTQIQDVLPYAGNCKVLTCENINGEDLQQLALCTNLKGLKISNLANDVTNLNVLANFEKLEKFTLTNSKVADITAIDKCRNLNSVSITKSNVRDIAPIVNLTKLENIDFTGNNITDVKPLSQLGKNQFQANMMQSSDMIDKLTRDMMSALMQLSNFKSEYARIQSGEIQTPSEDEMNKLITLHSQKTPFFESLGIKSVIVLNQLLKTRM